MLTFAEYRKRVIEEAHPADYGPDVNYDAAKKYGPGPRPEPAPASAPEPAQPASPTPVRPPMPDHLAADMERTVDQFISQLKVQLTNPMTGPEAQRGVWDRMKNWWSNVWHGRYNQQNPYFWKNKLGDDLGRQASPATESVEGMPLEHYMVLSDQALMLEVSLPPGAEGLQVVKIVDQWGRQFKQAVMGLLSRHTGEVEGMSDASPPRPAPAVSAAAHEEPEEKTEDDEDEPVAASAATPEKKPLVFDDLEEFRNKLKDEVKAMKDRLPATVYAKLMHHIEVGSDEHLNMVSTFLQNKRTAPMRDPADVGRTSPAAAEPAVKPPVERVSPKKEEPEDEDTRPPKPDARQWKELSVNEREQWDQAGGGSAGDASFYARHHHDIRTLPWILRIGDPRLTAIESIPGRSLYKRLVRQKRVETPAHPIRSKLDLEKAVEEAKRLHGEERETVSTDRKARHARRISKSSGSPVGDRTAPLTTTPEKEEETLGGDGLGPLGGFKDKLRPPRTAPLRTGGKVEDVPDANELRADLETIKGEIEPEVAEKLSHWIEKGEPEFLVSARDKLKMLKELIVRKKKDEPKPEKVLPGEGSGEGLDAFESTIQDRTAFLVSNFKHIVNETNQAVSILGEKKHPRTHKKRV